MLLGKHPPTLQLWPAGSTSMAMTRQAMTTMALRAVHTNQTSLSSSCSARGDSLLVKRWTRPPPPPSGSGLNQPVLFRA